MCVSRSLIVIALCAGEAAAALVCGAAHAAIVASVVRSARRRRLEIAWEVIPALVLAAVLVMTWRRMHVSA